MTLPAPLQPRLPPASASSPPNPHHPMLLGKWTHLWGATAPTSRGQQNQRNPSLPPAVTQNSLDLSTGLDRGGEAGQAGSRAQGHPPGGSQETGHTLVTSSNLGISALCPEPSSTRTPTHPSRQPLTKQKEQREGVGGDHSWGREGQTRNCGLALTAQPS